MIHTFNDKNKTFIKRDSFKITIIMISAVTIIHNFAINTVIHALLSYQFQGTLRSPYLNRSKFLLFRISVPKFHLVRKKAQKCLISKFATSSPLIPQKPSANLIYKGSSFWYQPFQISPEGSDLEIFFSGLISRGHSDESGKWVYSDGHGCGKRRHLSSLWRH